MAVDYRDLKVWQEAMSLAETVYRLCEHFPVEERYGLSAQMRRAVVSIPSCIAEGNARSSVRDYLRFLSMANGSLAEVQTQLLLSVRLGFFDSELAGSALDSVRSASFLLQSLRKSLKVKLQCPIHSPIPIP